MKTDKKSKGRMPNIFVGPLGVAQLNAMKFAEGLSKVDSIITLVEKMEAINELIAEKEMSGSELELAHKLLDELAHCVIDLSGGIYDDGTLTKEKIY